MSSAALRTRRELTVCLPLLNPWDRRRADAALDEQSVATPSIKSTWSLSGRNSPRWTAFSTEKARGPRKSYDDLLGISRVGCRASDLLALGLSELSVP